MWNMVKQITLAIFIFGILTGINCKNDSLILNEEIKPGRRDYAWKVDTLKANPGDLFYMYSLWGSTKTDIWVVGSADASNLSIWHYNGVNWSLNLDRLSSNLMSVFGFDKNNVWASCSPGGIYHYNGQQWSLAYSNSVSGTHPGLDNIWGDSWDNIYAVGSIDTTGGGYIGEVLNYDGTNWNLIPIDKIRVSFNRIRRGLKENGKYYLSGTRFESVGDTNKIYEFDKTKLMEIYSGQEVATVNEMAGRVYLCVGKKIFKYQNSQLNIWKDFEQTNHLGRIWGRNESDFFTVGLNGLTHYNGSDLITIYATDMFINDALVFEEDIYILFNNKIIVHGTLK